jgi:hypothetical protein
VRMACLETLNHNLHLARSQQEQAAQ